MQTNMVNACYLTTRSVSRLYSVMTGWLMNMEPDGEMRIAGETEVLGENLPQRHFLHHQSHLTRPGREPGPPRWKMCR
jgi:hypothetical protein